MTYQHECHIKDAAKFYTWIRTRGGVAIWRSVNLSNPGATWATPANELDGEPTPKPTWQADVMPEKIITDPAEIRVYTSKEVRRFHVAHRWAGAQLKLTLASSERLRRAVEKEGPKAYYEFDYMAEKNAVIMKEDSEMSLQEWAEGQGL